MLIYNYHPQTGEYIGFSEAEKGPVDDGEWLIPAHATTVEPPDKWSENHAIVWLGDAWGEIEDHRGEMWYHPDGRGMPVDFLGNPAERGLIDYLPPPPVNADAPKMRFALIHDGIVAQVITVQASAEWEIASGYSMVFDAKGEAKPGFRYDAASAAFTDEEPAA